MTSTANHQDQKHPQEKNDRAIIDRIFSGEPTNDNLADIGRLLIRYRNFPGAREIQKNLQLILKKWQLTEMQLYEKTRQLHATGKVYQRRNSDEDSQDWS